MVGPTRNLESPPELIGACVAGGIGRQFRVQFQDGSCSEWRHFAAFSNGDDAQRCLCELRQDGLNSRVVRYAHCPTAP